MVEPMYGMKEDVMVESDTEALFARVDTDPARRSQPHRLHGLLHERALRLRHGGALPRPHQGRSVLYGVRLFGKGSPAECANRQRQPYFACAEHDEYAPKDMVDALEEHLASTGRTPGRVVPRHPPRLRLPREGPVYDKDAAERHWERLHALFAQEPAGHDPLIRRVRHSAGPPMVPGAAT